jgi:hypothetical protein
VDSKTPIEVSGDQPASRPGKKSLYIAIAVILVAIALKYSDLSSLLSYGR